MAFYEFSIGEFKCAVINDGDFLYEGMTSQLYSNLTDEEHEKWGIDPADDILFSNHFLYLDTGTHKVLIDAGLGVRPEPNTGKLIAILKANDIRPEEIDIVCFTHAHPDHIGGNTDARGEVNFPNARYLITKMEWDEFTTRDTVSDAVQKNLVLIKDRFEFIESEEEIVPGVSVLFTPGHTIGHVSFLVESQGEKLLNLGDVIQRPLQLKNLHWYAEWDYDGEILAATRKRMLDWTAEENILVLSCHMPTCGLGYVKKNGDVWDWESVEGPRKS